MSGGGAPGAAWMLGMLEGLRTGGVDLGEATPPVRDPFAPGQAPHRRTSRWAKAEHVSDYTRFRITACGCSECGRDARSGRCHLSAVPGAGLPCSGYVRGVHGGCGACRGFGAGPGQAAGEPRLVGSRLVSDDEATSLFARRKTVRRRGGNRVARRCDGPRCHGRRHLTRGDRSGSPLDRDG
jgi:hypothetical protein